ncbi:chaplin [Streptomyces sp. NPDC051976]|uniref:chaplin n=1 Tax=Streptomyces sp. NPDC051976 TaxID=3154947 RepID=UPI00343C3389
MRNGAVLAALVGGIILAGGGVASADSHATGAVIGSPGVLSGNLVQVPVDVPINLCGDSIDVIGLLNPALGDSCTNGSSDTTSDGKNIGTRHMAPRDHHMGHMGMFSHPMGTPMMSSDAMNTDDCD